MKEVFIGIRIGDSILIRQFPVTFNGCQFNSGANMIDLQTLEILCVSFLIFHQKGKDCLVVFDCKSMIEGLGQ